MTSKLESALKRRRLKNLLAVLQAHGVTDWTVGAITDAELQGFGIGDLKIRRRLLKGFESVAKIKPPPATMVDVEGGTQTSWMSKLNGTTVESFRIGIYTVTCGEWKRVRDWALTALMPPRAAHSHSASDGRRYPLAPRNHSKLSGTFDPSSPLEKNLFPHPNNRLVQDLPSGSWHCTT